MNKVQAINFEMSLSFEGEEPSFTNFEALRAFEAQARRAEVLLDSVQGVEKIVAYGLLQDAIWGIEDMKEYTGHLPYLEYYWED